MVAHCVFSVNIKVFHLQPTLFRFENDLSNNVLNYPVFVVKKKIVRCRTTPWQFWPEYPLRRPCVTEFSWLLRRVWSPANGRPPKSPSKTSRGLTSYFSMKEGPFSFWENISRSSCSMKVSKKAKRFFPVFFYIYLGICVSDDEVTMEINWISWASYSYILYFLT